MLPNLIAVILLLVLIAAGVVMIIRALLEPVPGANTTCAACGHDAATLVDFTCPGCGRDVRDVGLTSTPLDSAVARFWRAAAVTCVAVTAFGLTSSLTWFVVPSTRIHDMTADLQPNFQTEIESVDMKFLGTSRGGRGGDDNAVVSGELLADLAVADGRMTTLQVRFPDALTRVTDENGNTRGEQPLAVETVRAWLEAGGVDTRSPENAQAAIELHDRIARMGRGWRASDHEHESMRSRSLFSGGRGASSYARPPRWMTPGLAIAWALLWLLGLRRWLRRRTVARDQRDNSTGAAAPPPQTTAVPA